MTDTTRLRWEPGEDGILFGYCGTLKPWVFAICPPGSPGEFWMISTSFPLGQPRYVGSEKEARKAAERWLEEFTASLGAVFPEPAKSKPTARGTAKPVLTPSAIREVLWDAGFASFSPGEMGFSVRRSPWAWGEVVIDLVGADLSSPDARPRSLLDDYAQTLRVAGYAARIVTDAVIASAKDVGDPTTSAPVAGEKETGQ